MRSFVLLCDYFMILSIAFAYHYQPRSIKTCIRYKTSILSSNNDKSNDSGSRRRKRASENANQNKAFEDRDRTLVDVSTIKSYVEPEKGPETKKEINSDGTSSLEDLFGLGDEMLGDLMDGIDELPVPREDLLTGKTVEEEKAENKGNKVFQLPDLTDFIKDGSSGSSSSEKSTLREKVASQSDSFKERITSNSGSKRNERRKRIEEINQNRVDRSDQEEYMRVMQLNPFADADDTLFREEVCSISVINMDMIFI